MSDKKYVYAVEHPDGYMKVGKATDPKSRKNQIQTGSPYELELRLLFSYYPPGPLGNRADLEDHIHASIEDSQIRGEWFDVGYVELLHLFARIERMDYDIVPGHKVIDKDRELQRKQEYSNQIGLQYKGPL